MIRQYAVVAFLVLLGIGVVAKASVTNMRIEQNTSTAQLTFYATDSLGYLEFLDLANQSGDIILTQAQSLPLNISQTYIILFVPYNASTQFESWSIQGNATISDDQYMTNMTLYGNTTLTANASNPANAVPEFPLGPLVVLIIAFAIIPRAVDGRQTPPGTEDHRRVASPQSIPRVC